MKNNIQVRVPVKCEGAPIVDPNNLSPSSRRILNVLHAAYPASLSFDAAARQAGVSKRYYRKYRAEVLGSGEVAQHNGKLKSNDGLR